MNVQKLQREPVALETRPGFAARRDASQASCAPALPRPRTIVERSERADAFSADVRSMCALIAEADRYGTTPKMEESYRALRSRLAQSFQALTNELTRESVMGRGFHGCGFEMILGSYSLEGLVRNTGVRAAERLAEVWRSLSLQPSAP